MKNLITTLTLVLLAFNSSGQGIFKQKQDFANGQSNRAFASSFSIDGKIYVSCGVSDGNANVNNDLWEYNVTQDQWSPRTPLIGNKRRNAFAFAINGKGYIGGGYNKNILASNPIALADFYEYNPNTNFWITRTFLPNGEGVAQAVSFVISNKGYVALGAKNGSVNTAEYSKKVLSYNPSNNTWTTKQDVVTGNSTFDNGVGAVDATAFVINNKAYIVGGLFYNGPFANLWKTTFRYNPSNDTWTNRKQTSVGISAGAGIATNGKGYVIAPARGYDQSQPDLPLGSKEIHTYDPVTNSWSVDNNGYPGLTSSGMFSESPCDYLKVIGGGQNGNTQRSRVYAIETEYPTSGPLIVCNSAQVNYSLSSVPQDASITWSKSSNLSIISGQGTGTVTIRGASSGNGNGWIKATLNGDCGTVSLNKFNVWVGEPEQNPPPMQGDFNVNQGSWELYSIDEMDGAESYTWVLPPTWSHHSSFDPNSNEVMLIVGSQSGYVRVRADNTCGQSNHTSEYVTVSGGGCSGPICYSMSPNPASSQVTIEETSNSKRGEIRIDVRNFTGELIHTVQSTKKKLDFKTQSWPRGVYYLHIQKGKNSVTKRLVLE